MKGFGIRKIWEGLKKKNKQKLEGYPAVKHEKFTKSTRGIKALCSFYFLPVEVSGILFKLSCSLNLSDTHDGRKLIYKRDSSLL